MLPLRNVHKFNWTSSNERTHKQIDHILIDKRWHSSIIEVRSFGGDEYDTDHYLVVSKHRERLGVIKKAGKNLIQDIISGSKMSEGLGKSISLSLRTGLQLWRT
jgi:hypothetical protein